MKLPRSSAALCSSGTLPRSPTPFRRAAVIFAIVQILMALSNATAETMAQRNIREMCREAQAIILGEVADGDRIRVIRWLRSPQGAGDLAQEIEIPGLSKLALKNSTKGYVGFENQPDQISSGRFVAFLQWGEDGWQAICPMFSRDTHGRNGVIWIQDDQCFAYLQGHTLNPCHLMDTRLISLESLIEPVTTEESLIEEIRRGLADLEGWNDVLAEKDPSARATRLAKYLLASTSSREARRTFAREAGEAIRALEQDAVPALVGALAARTPQDDPTEILRTLSRLNADTRPATSTLIKLLKAPEIVSPYYVLAALGNAEDPLMLPFLPPFLLSSDAQIREQATAAVAAIPVEAFSPGELAERSSIVAVIHVLESLPPKNPHDPTLSRPQTISHEAIVIDVLKGSLSGKFILEIPVEFYPRRKLGSTTCLAFLTQDAGGRITPSSSESLKPYNLSKKQAYWPHRKWIPLGTISTEMKSPIGSQKSGGGVALPGSANSPRPEQSHRRGTELRLGSPNPTPSLSPAARDRATGAARPGSARPS